MPKNKQVQQRTEKRLTQPKRQPEKKIGPFNAGIGACVWTNTIETENGPRTVRSITVNPRRYFDRESNQWKDASSFNPADLPALIFALQKAQEYCYEMPLPDQSSDDAAQHPNASVQGEQIPF